MWNKFCYKITSGVLNTFVQFIDLDVIQKKTIVRGIERNISLFNVQITVPLSCILLRTSIEYILHISLTIE